jgi:hypothetical protein
MSANKKHYDELLELLAKAELAARNGQWATCGTWAKNATERAYQIAKESLAAVRQWP